MQNSAQTIHETQGYALRQLGDLADKIEEKNNIGDLAETAKEAEAEVQKWLVVLARCFELHDAVAVLELDRVLDASPDELDRHRLGLKSARRDRLELISERTEHLLGRMNAAVGRANSKVLFNPKQSPAVVKSSNHVATDVHEFHELLGIESGRESSEARRWKEAAAERWDKARATGAQGIDDVKRFGSETRGQAGSVKGQALGQDRRAEAPSARRRRAARRAGERAPSVSHAGLRLAWIGTADGVPDRRSRQPLRAARFRLYPHTLAPVSPRSRCHPPPGRAAGRHGTVDLSARRPNDRLTLGAITPPSQVVVAA